MRHPICTLTTALVLALLAACSSQAPKTETNSYAYNFSAYEGAVSFSVQVKATGDIPEFWG